MKFSIPLRRSLPGAAVLLLLQYGGPVLAADGPAGPVASAAAVAAPAGNVSGDVEQLLQLLHDHQLAELRTTYNGSYGASLFFYAPEMTYYVALFQHRHFWRVVRSQDDTRANAIYANFVSQTEQLASIEIQRTQLQAQKAQIELGIAWAGVQARRLQADLDVARAQQAQVAERQRQLRGETAGLGVEAAQARARLRDLQRQVLDLQRATEAGLPAG
ncbi:hypothetical protein CY652_17740 [Burkholderia sp. WAC0059]|uniref:DUF2968 domain-containing protein n=1 Tax=Burkholderia sp. WAC0059 TaxID=2066022 RepID=UPI000C7F391F|nr:DUF2968 domain-containing protein [Burkholderia sp. WAC0059]PLZ01167.1 hypothetical protein CY652_17740 [Burkholderia sp. WAC0059]